MNSYNFQITWKGLMIFLLLWILLYIEPISLGPLKISQIWKTIVVFGLIIYLLPKRIPAFGWIGFAFAFKFLFYSYLPYGFFTALQNFVEALIFPLALIFLYVRYKGRYDAPEHLMSITIFLALFLIYSAVPFMFGLKTFNPVTTLEKYGLEAKAMKGLFYHVATSSKLFTVATIILLITYKRFQNSFINLIIWFTAVSLGTYFVYSSWTRTGWFIFIIALCVTLFYNTGLKKKIVAIFLSIIIAFSILLIYNQNEALRLRVTGGATYRSDTELSIEQLAQSRVPFIITAMENLQEEGGINMIIGYGEQRGIDLFEKKTGMAINSHNRTFEILEASGILGFILYLLFLYKIWRSIGFRKNTWKYSHEEKRLFVVLTIMFLGFFISSHGMPIWSELIFACIIITLILRKSSQEISIFKDNNINPAIDLISKSQARTN